MSHVCPFAEISRFRCSDSRTSFRADTIQPWIAHSPFLSWLYTITSVQGASNLLGVVEIGLGILLGVRPRWPRASVVGSFGAIIAFLLTFSFLLTTPDLSPAWSGFLMKDLILIGAALWTAADALRAIEHN